MVTGAVTRTVRHGRQMALAAALLATTGLVPMVLPAIALAQATAASPASLLEERSYTIPAQPMTGALILFGQQADLQVTVDGALLRGLNAPTVQGRMAGQQALQQLLAGSGLTHRVENGTTIIIEKATQQTGNVLQLDPVYVIGTAQSRYDSRDAETGSLIAKDVTDIPRTVDIIPEQLLLDQQAREMEDVYRLSPNVVTVDGFGGTREDYLIRGFRRRDDIYRNGVRLKTNSRIDPQTVDNIQFLKGPVAEIGQMTPGGLVNVITKKPEFEASHSAEINLDEHGTRQLGADLTGPVNDAKTLAFRVNTAVEDSENFRNSEIERQYLSSSLAWEGNSGARIGLNHEYSHDERPLDRGHVTQAVANGRREVVRVSPETRYDNPDFNKREASYHILELDTSIPLGDSAWSIDNKLFYSQETTDDLRVEVTNVNAAGVLTRQVQGNRDRTLATQFARMQLTGDVELGIPVDIAAGVEYHQQDEDWINFSGANQVGGTIYNPSSFTVVDNSATPNSQLWTDVRQVSYGPYAQTDLELIRNLTLTLGARYEYFDGEFDRVNQLTNAVSGANPEKDSHLAKSAGLVWKPHRDLSLYGSYAETFQTQNIYGGNSTVVVLPPEQGEQYEIGAKWSGLDGKLLLTGALFQIEQDNVVETVNGNPVLTGGQRSRGAEVSAVANPMQGFNLRGGLGLVDAEIVSTSATTDGKRPTNTPPVTASLWASYEFQQADSPVKGLGFGAGAYYVGKRYGDSANSWDIGDYTLFDVGAWYYLPLQDEKRLRFDLGVKNLMDEEYYAASGGNFRVSVGSPRTFFAGLRAEF